MYHPKPILEPKIRKTLPFYASKIEAGFPSPADDYAMKGLDLHDHLISHPSSTFYVKVENDEMIGAGICPGDLLIIDRSLTAKNNSVVLAILNGEFILRRLIKRPRHDLLVPENEKYPSIVIEPGFDFEVWGVVIHAIHHLL